MRICRGEESPRLPFHLSSPLTNIVFLPTLHTYNLHFLAPHAILPNKRLMKQAVKNVDQSQHTSRSGTSLRNFPRDSRKDQKDLMKGEDLTLTPKTPLWANDSLYREKWSHWSPTFLFGTKLFVMYHTHPTELVHRVWLVNTLTSTVFIRSPIIYTWTQAASCYLRTMGKEFNFLYQQMFPGQELVTNPGDHLCGRLAFSWTPQIFWSNPESQKYPLPDPREEYEDACRLHN